MYPGIKTANGYLINSVDFFLTSPYKKFKAILSKLAVTQAIA